MKKSASINIYAVVGIAIAVSSLFAYSFAGAVWRTPPASPPNQNSEGPINVGPDTQIKSGNIGGNIFHAATSVWSADYCDENGENCTLQGQSGGNPLNACVLEYRMVWNGYSTAWESIQLSGETNQGNASVRVIDGLNKECRGDGCGPQLRVVCNGESVGAQWVTGAWSAWTTSGNNCGSYDMRTRSVQCMSGGTQVADYYCSGTRPPTQEIANHQPIDGCGH